MRTSALSELGASSSSADDEILLGAMDGMCRSSQMNDISTSRFTRSAGQYYGGTKSFEVVRASAKQIF